MLIYDDDFTREDPDKKGYSQLELDFYGWISPDETEDNHRLSIRKNLRTGKYEAFAHYHAQITRPAFDSVLNEGTNLQALCDYCDNLLFKYHKCRNHDRVFSARVRSLELIGDSIRRANLD